MTPQELTPDQLAEIRARLRSGHAWPSDIEHDLRAAMGHIAALEAHVAAVKLEHGFTLLQASAEIRKAEMNASMRLEVERLRAALVDRGKAVDGLVALNTRLAALSEVNAKSARQWSEAHASLLAERDALRTEVNTVHAERDAAREQLIGLANAVLRETDDGDVWIEQIEAMARAALDGTAPAPRDAELEPRPAWCPGNQRVWDMARGAYVCALCGRSECGREGGNGNG